MSILKKVYLANPKGFCAGVKYAISYVENVHEMYQDETIYVRKEIVHNRRVVEDMQKKGIHFVNELNEVPDNSIVIFSAHGVSPEIHKMAKEKNFALEMPPAPWLTGFTEKPDVLKIPIKLSISAIKGMMKR